MQSWKHELKHDSPNVQRIFSWNINSKQIIQWKILHWKNPPLKSPPLNKSSTEKILHWKPLLKNSSTDKFLCRELPPLKILLKGFKYFGMVVQNICICSLKITIELLQSFDNKIEIFCFQPQIFTIIAQILARGYQFAFWCPIIKFNIFIQKYQYLQFCY